MINIHIKDKFYQDKKILENINIRVNEGEFLSIIGPSGCGKTTLLNIASSLDKDFNGKVTISSSNIGFIFQDHRLIPWLTVKENLLIISKDKDINQINELLNIVGLNDILDVYPKNLSGGMARRVSFVRAFINKPKVIFLDEPFISLDYPTATSLKKDFLNLIAIDEKELYSADAGFMVNFDEVGKRVAHWEQYLTKHPTDFYPKQD